MGAKDSIQISRFEWKDPLVNSMKAYLEHSTGDTVILKLARRIYTSGNIFKLTVVSFSEAKPV